MDEIRVTPSPASRNSSRTARREEVGQLQEVLQTKERPPLSDAAIRIRRNSVGPALGHRAERPVGMLDRHAVLPPQLLGDHEGEHLVAKGMERVGDPDQSRSDRIICS